MSGFTISKLLDLIECDEEVRTLIERKMEEASRGAADFDLSPEVEIKPHDPVAAYREYLDHAMRTRPDDAAISWERWKEMSNVSQLGFLAIARAPTGKTEPSTLAPVSLANTIPDDPGSETYRDERGSW